NPGSHTVDGVEGTKWAAEGTDEWIQYYIGEDKTVEEVSIKFFYPAGNTTRRYKYNIQVSMDEKNWETLYKEQVSGGSEVGTMTHKLETPVEARFVRI
ncbi:MAG: discoidin domain-containing protein, partial [Niameybacter sp.]